MSTSIRSGISIGSASTLISRETCESTPPSFVPTDSPTSSITTCRLDRLVEADLLEVDVGDAAGDHVLLVVLEDRRMGRLLAFEHDVEDRVQARWAGQDAAKLSLGDTDRVRRLPAPVEDAGNHPVAAQAARIGGTASLALRYFQLDSFTCHGAAV